MRAGDGVAVGVSWKFQVTSAALALTFDKITVGHG